MKYLLPFLLSAASVLAQPNPISVAQYNPTTPPTAYVYPNGSYSINGKFAQTQGSTTAGIQEALNALPAGKSFLGGSGVIGGGKVLLAPGIYYTTTTITNPYPTISGVGAETNNPPCSYIIEGQGLGASQIVYVGSGTNQVMTFGYPNTYNSIQSLEIRYLGMFSTVNGCTNLLGLVGIWTNSANGYSLGSISRAEISYCWFGYWNMVTNLGAFSPAHLDPPGNWRQNLVGIDVNCMFNDVITIKDCSFSFLASGIHLASDHGALYNNMFEHVGRDTLKINSWPTTDPRSIGPAIWLSNAIRPNDAENWGHNFYHIAGNQFVHCDVLFANSMQYVPSAGYAWLSNQVAQVIETSTSESSGTNVAAMVTLGNPATFFNCKNFGITNEGTGGGTVLSYYLTDSDWTKYTNTVASSTMVNYVDFYRGFDTAPFGAGGFKVINAPVPNAPTPAFIGANNGFLWTSNKYLYYSYTVDGSASNNAVKIAP
jgi:hypothetical protein